MTDIATTALAVMALHMCPVTVEGQHLYAVPARELLYVLTHSKDAAVPVSKRMVVVSPTDEKCTPDDGETVPGIEP